MNETIQLEVNGRLIEVDKSFNDLSPEDKQRTINEIAFSFTPTKEELAAQEKESSDVLDTTGIAAVLGAVGGMGEVAAGRPIENVLGRKLGATAIQNPATGEPAGWKWTRKTGFGAGLDPTVEGQSSEFKRREAEGKFQDKPGKREKIPGKALTLDQYLQNKARDEAEAKAKALAAKQAEREFSFRKPTSFGGKTLGLGGRMLAGAGTLGMGAEAVEKGTEAYDKFKSGDIKGAARAGRGALLNTLGSLGSAATFVPHPLFKGIGAAVGTAAPIVNMMLEEAGYKQGGLIKKYAKGQAVKGGLEALKKFNLGDLEGKTIIGTMSDRTAVDLLRNLRGGPLFPTIHENAAWAVDAPGAATRLLNAVKAAGGPEKAVVAPMLMSPIAHRSNRDVAKLALKEFQENYGAGKFSPERLNEIETAVRKVPGLEQHPGLLDPNAASMFDKMTFGQRGATVDWLGSKPRKAPAIDLENLLRGTTEKGLEGTELGAIGPSLFKLSGERSIDPSLHGSYSHILHGELLGGMNPIPREFVFRDLESKAMKELGRPLSDYNYRTSVGIPSQFVDEKLLRSWEELGFMKPKSGGLSNPD